VRDNTLLIAGMIVLSAGTYAFRAAGQLLRARIGSPPSAQSRTQSRTQRLLETATVVLLAALVAVTALTDSDRFTGPARPAGVLVAGVLAWRKAPFIVVVLAAAATTAALRLTGVP
jgi:Branched-chain amino acid transport protein (AzlD)